VCAGREASPDLRALLERATAKRRAARFQSARELADALDELPSSALEVGDPASRAPTVASHRGPHPGVGETGRYVATTESAREHRRPMWVHVAPPVVALAALTAAVFVLKSSASKEDDPGPPPVEESTPALAQPIPPPAPARDSPPHTDPAAPRPSEDPPVAQKDIAVESAEAPIPDAPAPRRVRSVQELWSGAPKVFVAALDAAERGIPLSKKTILYVHEFNGKNPGDPRGHLLFAHSYMVKGWRKDATNEYAIAYKLNPDVTDARHRGRRSGPRARRR
jgi:hypothetical protein